MVDGVLSDLRELGDEKEDENDDEETSGPVRHLLPA